MKAKYYTLPFLFLKLPKLSIEILRNVKERAINEISKFNFISL